VALGLRGAVVVLTGASRGIGAAIAVDLAGAGAHLVLVARDRTGLDAVAAQVVGAGGAVTVVVADLTTDEDRARVVAAAQAVGPVAGLINNAGMEIPLAVVDLSADDVQRQIALNLHAPIDLARRLTPGMVARERGAVVFVSSMSGKAPTPYNAVYTATKYGLVGFSASLRLELEGTGVTCGVVCPGFVASAGMWADTGVAPPRWMGEVPLARVVGAVRRVLSGAGEVLVTPTPMRPLLAVGQLFPGLSGRVLGWLGVLDTLRERTRVTTARRQEASSDTAR